jgi:cbb3-type cytochrome oxidase subunit 1
MECIINAFIRASLLWFAGGVVHGVGIAVHPQWLIYRPAHAHMSVVGFQTMLEFGVGYQLLPRLFGHPLYSRRLAVAHLFLANLGLSALVAGFFVQPHAAFAGRWIIGAGGGLFAVGAIFWVLNLWHTFDAAESRQRARGEPTRPLPTLKD